MPTGHPLEKDKIQYLLKHFCNTSNRELSQHLGVCESTVERIATKYHLKKSKEYRSQVNVRAGKASSIARGGKALNITPEVIARRAETFKKTFKMEEIRYKWGLERKTKLRLTKEPRLKRDQRHHLQEKGYIIDEQNLIAYYTPETRRSFRYENRTSTNSRYKMYYSFKPYEERRLD